MTNTLPTIKLGLMAAAAFGMTAVASNADAKPYWPYHRGKTRITRYQYRQMKRADRRKAHRDFRNLDKQRNGVLTRADLVPRRHRLYRYERRYTNRGYRRVRDYRNRKNFRRRRAGIRHWRNLRRIADRNYDGRVTRYEFTRARRLMFDSRIRRNYVVTGSYRRAPHRNPYKRTRF